MKSGDTVVDRYRLESKLGMGGMGTVWSAEHIQTGRHFALKIMHSTVAANEDSRQRFLKEAKASARIGHPNVIDILDVGELPDGALFMAMELLDGIALADALRLEPPLSLHELLLIVRESALALAAAHAVGIVHRDVKPANIFLHRDRATGLVAPKVLDFGVSKFSFLEESATQTGSLLGSPRYMSPEQARSAAQADARSDVWSLGVILFEAASGAFPHDGDSFSNLVVAIATVPPKLLSQVAPGLPPGLVALVEECLRVRDERLGGCDLLAQRIEAILATYDLAAIPCARGKNKKPLDRPGDLRFRSHPGGTEAAPRRAPPEPAAMAFDEPSTNRAPEASPPAAALAATSLFPDAATRPMGTQAPGRFAPSAQTQPAAGRAVLAATMASAAAPGTADRAPARTTALYAQETTTIHNRAQLGIGPPPAVGSGSEPYAEGRTQLISVSAIEASRQGVPRTTARMDPPPYGGLVGAPSPGFGSAPATDQLVESVAMFNVERHQAGATSTSGPPPGGPQGASSSRSASRGGVAVGIAILAVVGVVAGGVVFMGRSAPADEPPAAAQARPAAVAPPPPPAAAPAAEALAESPEEPLDAPKASAAAAPSASALPSASASGASAAPAAPPPSSQPWPAGHPARRQGKCAADDPIGCLDPGF